MAYLGMDRPKSKTDYGEYLVRKLIKGDHELAGLILHPCDPLMDLAKEHSVPCIPVPFELLQPVPLIRKSLSENERFISFYQTWLSHIRSFGADLGVSIWSAWVPPDLFSMPKHGFINYHPAPLPKMRGMEPDTFAILDGLDEIYGTVHKVNASFDCGDIVRWTKKISIHSYDTPVSVLDRLYREGVRSVLDAVDSFADGSVKTIPQKAGEGSVATRAMAREASFIDWDEDTTTMLDRKLRAFCGQDIGIRLKARFKNEIRDVVDLEVYKGEFPGRPGQMIGCYRGRGAFHGAPVVRVPDGAAVILFGRIIEPLEFSSMFYCESPQEKLIAPGFRRRQTSLNTLMRSVAVKKRAQENLLHSLLSLPEFPASR